MDTGHPAKVKPPELDINLIFVVCHLNRKTLKEASVPFAFFDNHLPLLSFISLSHETRERRQRPLRDFLDQRNVTINYKFSESQSMQKSH